MVRVHVRADRVRPVRRARRSQGNPRADLRRTISPLFFLPWAAENLENSLAGAETFTVTLGKEAVTLTPLRSAARSFRELRRKFVTGQAIETLKAFTDETTTTVFLLRPQRVDTRRERLSAEPVADGDATAAAPRQTPRRSEDAAPEAGDGRPRRRRRRGGKGAAAKAPPPPVADADEAEAAAEEAPIAFADEGVEVEPPTAEDDVPPAEDADSSTDELSTDAPRSDET